MSKRIYTKTGDTGDTGLFGGGRVSKANPRVIAYGEVDELNAVLGWAITQTTHAVLIERLTSLQSDLFTIGAHLATPPGARTLSQLPQLPGARIAEMEGWIDDADASLPELKSFILPGGSPGGAALHVARAVCRRAERAIVELAGQEEIDPSILSYFNRLSDLLFMLARLENARAGFSDARWQP